MVHAQGHADQGLEGLNRGRSRNFKRGVQRNFLKKGGGRGQPLTRGIKIFSKKGEGGSDPWTPLDLPLVNDELQDS
jgi:hypothetical protein